MPYQTRPRYQARIERRNAAPKPAPRTETSRPAAASRRWETTPVLDALTEMHNAPVRRPRER